MKKNDFIRKWSKSASGGKATEAFERDVEALVRSTVRASVAGVASGLREAARSCRSVENRRLLERVAAAVPSSVEQALARLYE